MTRTFDLSFEFFPPKSLDGSFRLWNAVKTLQVFSPDFMSITYGAGGSIRDLTCSVASVISQSYGVPVAGHLTCVDASKNETLSVARAYAAKGVKRIVALRGDGTGPNGEFVAQADGFSGSIELITALKALGDFDVTVAAYPNRHPDAVSDTSDIDHLKAKFDAGADRAITQFFFEKNDFLRFRDKCAAAGITQEIVPGVLPIENWQKTRKFAKVCAIPIPSWLEEGFRHAGAADTERLFATALCAETCDDLLNEGVSGLHFYTLNDPSLTGDVCRALGRTPRHLALQASA
ncbi:MAG: methylenetetrahydrofolate reductase [NAD(P)H] [Amylibacter sp.]